MTHFAQSLQQPINPQIQEMIDNHFNVFSLYENHGIHSLQTYIQKMSVSLVPILEVYGEIILPYFVWQIKIGKSHPCLVKN
jgi:hypothetical protein